jgi:hypothetical protein
VPHRAAALALVVCACGDDADVVADARADAAIRDTLEPIGPCRSEVVIVGRGIDVQIPVVFDTGWAVASGSMQPDCDDLRVETPDGLPYPFWLESGCGTAETRLWVRSAAVAPGSIYLSWGYPSRPRASSVEDTFRGIVGAEGDLIGAWPMEDVDESRAADATGGGHDGALVGGPTRSEYAFGRTLVLDGVDDAMLVNDAPAFDTPSFSFEARIWPEDAVENAIAARNDFSNASGWTLWLGHPSAPGRVLFEYAREGGTLSVAGTLESPGYVAVTFDGTMLRLYVDGVLDGSAELPGGVAESFDDELRVGTTNGTASDGSPFFRGQIDDVRYWSRALPSVDVARLYQNRGTYVTAALPGRVLLLDRGAGVTATVLMPHCQNGTPPDAAPRD